ncbi:hypothetical protein PQR52_10220 [Paraburkholderia aspalathi]|uniref:hypothetical protein n=1 Tax=Paraburkholderia aspalathi TaxID=1324617 RepID=UPI0038B6F04D
MPKKIDDAMISEIKSALAAGKSVRAVADALQVNRRTVAKYADEQAGISPVAGEAAAPAEVRGHLDAILAQRLEWPQQDRLLASQLAGLRATLDKERARLSGESSVVATAAGSVKAHPGYQVVDKLARQEAQMSKRLGLGMQRNAASRYNVNASPLEKRAQLWAEYLEHFQLDDLVPGAWRYMVREAGCEIPEDSINWPNGPKSLPVAGKVHETGHYYPVSAGV